MPVSTINTSRAVTYAGAVLQVVSATYSTQVSTGSFTFADTGLTASITPTSSTSKILVKVCVNGIIKDPGNTYGYFRLLRNSTTISDIERLVGYNNSTAPNAVGGIAIDVLDSPATTSSTTYKVQFANRNATGTIYMCAADGGTASTSSIILLEIAA